MNHNKGLVTDFLEKQAAINPDKIALVFNNREWTFSNLYETANKFSQWLIDQGVKPHDRVVLFGHNSDWAVILLFGTIRAGAIFVPVNPSTSHSSFMYILKDAKPRVLVTEAGLQAKIKILPDFDTKIKILLIPSDDNVPSSKPVSDEIFDWNDILRGTYKDNNNSKAKPNDVALLIYTSGSTGDPKGVIEPHSSITFVTNAINQIIGNTIDDNILCGLPLSFDYGLYQIFLAYQVGAQLVITDFGFPLAIPGLLKRHSITGFPGVPSLFSLLLRSKLLERIHLPKLRYITSTGDVFPVELIRKLDEMFPHINIFPMYGLTECKRVSILPKEYFKEYQGSVGLPLPGTQVTIVDENGKELSRGLIGELVVKGPHIMGGYWNDPVETEKRFRQLENGIALFTNDLFMMNENGFLFFQGRSDNFIKSRGQKVSPIWIERLLYSIDGVIEAAVVAKPDPINGEVIIAIISKDANKLISADTVLGICRRNLSPAELPYRVIIIDKPLPKTPNGKIDRLSLQRAVESEFHVE